MLGCSSANTSTTSGLQPYSYHWGPIVALYTPLLTMPSHCSLTENRHRALFVHVPPYSQVFGAKLLDDVMRVIIQHALKQIPASQMTSLSLSAAAGKPLRPKACCNKSPPCPSPLPFPLALPLLFLALTVCRWAWPCLCAVRHILGVCCSASGSRGTATATPMGSTHTLHLYAHMQYDVSVSLLTCSCRQGGHLEFGESFVECATREVREECHVELRDAHVATTLNVVRKEEDYHYVVIVVTGEIDEVSSLSLFSCFPSVLFTEVSLTHDVLC